MQSLAGRRLKVFDHLALLTIYGDGLVAILHLLLCIAAIEY